MKTIFTALFALLCAHICAQGTFRYQLEVRDNQGHAKGNVPVIFIEKNTFEQLKLKTDAGGKLNVTFDHGDVWVGSVGEMYNCLLVENKGMRGEGSELITYDLKSYERENRLLPDRRTFTFEQVPQTLRAVAPPTSGYESIVCIKLVSGTEEVFPNIPVTLTCFELKQQFTTKTNNKGEAIFQVPVSNDYEVDVNNIPSLSYIDLDNRSKLTTITLPFQKNAFSEKTVEGFITQQLPANPKPSSSHGKVSLTILKNGEPIANEPVFLRMSKSAQRYKGTTNEKGEVVFMLPLRNKFLVDFLFQHDAAVIDLSRMQGFAESSQTIHYKPDPRLEHIEQFIPKAKDIIDYEIESFVNAQYPEPTNDVELFLKWGSKFNASSKEAVVEIGFKVKSSPGANPTARQLQFVVDVSGSMASDDRLELVKNTLVELIGKLGPKDEIGIVVFDDMANMVWPMQPVTDKQTLITLIKMLSPRGGTNSYNGLKMGFEELAKKRKPGTVGRVILLTDGYCSVPPEQTIELANGFVKKGIQISAIGVGTDYNQALLSQLASVGGGLMQMAGDPEQIQKAFLKELNNMITPIGEKVKLEIIYNDAIVYRQLIGYPNEVVSNGKVTVDIEHLFPGLQKMALAKFDIINSTPEIEKKPVIARMTYTDVKTNQSRTVEKKLYPEWTTATGAMDMTLDKNHKKILAIAIANQSLKTMANSFEAGKQDGAQAAAQSGIDQIKRLFPDANLVEVEALVDELQKYVSMFEQQKLYGNKKQ